MTGKLVVLLSLLVSHSVMASEQFNCSFIANFQTQDPASTRLACGDKEGFVLKTAPVSDFRVVAKDKLGGQRILTLKDLPSRDMGYILSESYLRIRDWLGDSEFVNFDLKLDPATELYTDTKTQKSRGSIGDDKIEVKEEVATPKSEGGISWSHDEEKCLEHQHDPGDVEKVLEKIKEW